MSKKSAIIISAIAVISLCLSVAAFCLVMKPEAPTGGDIQYVMYLGTNDKDSNQPVFNAEDAKAKVEEILLEHFGGYTIQEANGGWVDSGTIYQEYTLVIYLSDTTLEAVHAAADDLIQAFHQSTVLIQANETKTEFYSGSNG